MPIDLVDRNEVLKILADWNVSHALELRIQKMQSAGTLSRDASGSCTLQVPGASEVLVPVRDILKEHEDRLVAIEENLGRCISQVYSHQRIVDGFSNAIKKEAHDAR